VQAAVKAAELRLNGRGRVNLRPSGTENLVRVMVEGPDEQEIHEIAAGIAALIK
jgi:phosphoglucosamine mutase